MEPSKRLKSQVLLYLAIRNGSRGPVFDLTMRKRGGGHGDMMLFSLVTTIAIEFGEALLRVKLQSMIPARILLLRVACFVV